MWLRQLHYKHMNLFNFIGCKLHVQCKYAGGSGVFGPKAPAAIVPEPFIPAVVNWVTWQRQRERLENAVRVPEGERMFDLTDCKHVNDLIRIC